MGHLVLGQRRRNFWKPSIPLIPGGDGLIGDFNGDGKPDIIAGNVLLLNGTTTDFEITASALSPGSITPGGSTSGTITSTPFGGFGGAVALSCTGLPAGANCTFAPATDSERLWNIYTHDHDYCGNACEHVYRECHRDLWVADAPGVANGYGHRTGGSGFFDDRWVWRNGDGGAWADRDLCAFLGTERWIRRKRDADVQRCAGHVELQYLASYRDFERDDGYHRDGHGHDDGRCAGALA